MGREVRGELQPKGQLTDRSRFSLTYLPVPAELGYHITTLYHFSCHELDIREIQPAAIGHLAIFPYGKGAIHFRDGRSDPSHETNLLTPLSAAAPFTVDGPFEAIGAALTPLGWAELTGLHAAEHANRFYRAADFLGEEIGALGAQWCEAFREEQMSAQDCSLALADWIGANLTPLSDDHRTLIGQVVGWLGSHIDPQVDALYAASGFSKRQTLRLVDRYFGLPPNALRRKYRALRAAAMLSVPDLPAEEEAAIIGAFYDQPHLIREIRLFVGRTPARLSDEPDSYLTEMLELRNLREIS